MYRNNFNTLTEELIKDIQIYGVRLQERNIASSDRFLTEFIYSYNNKTYYFIKQNGEVITSFKVN